MAVWSTLVNVPLTTVGSGHSFAGGNNKESRALMMAALLLPKGNLKTLQLWPKSRQSYGREPEGQEVQVSLLACSPITYEKF